MVGAVALLGLPPCRHQPGLIRGPCAGATGGPGNPRVGDPGGTQPGRGRRRGPGARGARKPCSTGLRLFRCGGCYRPGTCRFGVRQPACETAPSAGHRQATPTRGGRDGQPRSSPGVQAAGHDQTGKACICWLAASAGLYEINRGGRWASGGAGC